MRAFKIFYSWQSDRELSCCKSFIRKAADDAALRLSQSLGLQITVDSDTDGVTGTPPINETILRKIDECDIFLADVTFVASLEGEEKLLPNPNVMGEYGYALKSKGFSRILLVMNTAYGPPEKLPFDLHHLRHPARYVLEASAPDGERRKTRDNFSLNLERNIAAIIDELLKAPPAANSNARWDEAFNCLTHFSSNRFAGRPVLVSNPKLVVHVIPLTSLDQPKLRVADVKTARKFFVLSFNDRVEEHADEHQWWSSGPPRAIPNMPNPEARWSFLLARPGLFEVCATIGGRIGDDPEIVIQGRDIEQQLVNAVDRIAIAAHHLNLGGPALIAAGLEGIEDVRILRPSLRPGGQRIRKREAILGVAKVQDLKAPLADHLEELMEKLWLIGGWDDGSPYFSEGHWTGYE
jgi:hypothetical protein